jgi:hypothetical protein
MAVTQRQQKVAAANQMVVVLWATLSRFYHGAPN